MNRSADLDQDCFETIPPESEPGMNFISADFDLVMVNRTNERLYGKSMVALLGKKCYREFEKRDEPCPHCPGRLALVTGQAQEAETEGVRDDGSRFAARIRAHPVMGPDNKPTGFIEVVEDITEQKRMESLARIDAELLSDLAKAQNTQRALRAALGAALRVEGIDCGCVFSLGQAGEKPTLVVQRNLTPESLEALADLVVGSAAASSHGADASTGTDAGATPASLAGIEGAPRALAVIPILHRSRPVAVMAVGTTTYPDIPATLRAGLKGLGATAGNAITRIRAEQSRGDAVADLETVIINAPVAAWTLDAEGSVTMWNRAAERLFGWKAAEILRSPSPFPGIAQFGKSGLPSTSEYETALVAKDGHPVEVRLVTSAFRDVVGIASTTIVMAEDLSLKKHVAEMERRLLSLGHDPIAGARSAHTPSLVDPPSGTALPTGILVIDADESRGRELVDILSSLGYAALRCGSVGEAAASMTAAKTETAPFDLAIVDLIAPDGTSALDQKTALRSLGMTGPVIVSSDSEVRGHEHHGFAAAIRRPHTAQGLADSIRQALGDNG